MKGGIFFHRRSKYNDTSHLIIEDLSIVIPVTWSLKI